MFNLEESILEWRGEMQAVGIKNPDALDELESHLREEAERQIKLGVAPQDAFETAARRIGQANTLNREFKKNTGIKEVKERMKRSVLRLAGIPNHYLDPSMNTSGPNSNIEPGWATYLKAAMFVAPAFWILIIVMVKCVPSLEGASHNAGFTLPAFSRVNIGIVQLIKDHFFQLVSGVILALILLEWRSAIWRRYRRAVIGFTAFFLNFSLLVSLFLIVVTAVIVLGTMPHAGK